MLIDHSSPAPMNSFVDSQSLLFKLFKVLVKHSPFSHLVQQPGRKTYHELQIRVRSAISNPIMLIKDSGRVCTVRNEKLVNLEPRDPSFEPGIRSVVALGFVVSIVDVYFLPFVAPI